MAVFEKTVQPQRGVYGWYAERNADSIAIYIGRAGKGGTLCRGVNEMLRTPFTSNDRTQEFSSLDTNFVVGTAILYFEKNGWCCTWRHISDDPKGELDYVKSANPILQNPNAKIEEDYKLKRVKDYWKEKNRPEEERWREAESAVFSLLDKAIA